MKLKKILAAVAAAAIAVSAMAVNTFALSTKDYFKDGVVYINADKPEDPTWAIDAGVDQTTIYGVTFHVTFGSAEWYGGGIGANSPSTSWKSIEWGTNAKEITADVENGTITWLSDTPIFKADDKYAQLWLQVWTGADSMTIVSADVLGEGGTILSTEDAAAPAEEAPAEEEAAPVEEEAAAEEDEDEDVDVDDVDVEEEEEEEDAAPAEEEEEEEEDAAPAETEAAPEVAPAADTAPTPAAGTGNVPAAAMVSVMAVAGAAAIVAKKRK